jgi:DNA repair exonuclease SbcCD ATPase subunit
MSGKVTKDMRNNYQVYVVNLRAKGKTPESFDEFVNNYVQSLKEQLRDAFKKADDYDRLRAENDSLRAANESQYAGLTDQVNALTARAERAEQVLTRLAEITSNVGAMFMDEDHHDDWESALAWIEKHLSFTPEQSQMERNREVINGWREFSKELRERAERAEDQADRLAKFGPRITDWLAKGNQEPMWYEDFMQAANDHNQDTAQP